MTYLGDTSLAGVVHHWLKESSTLGFQVAKQTRHWAKPDRRLQIERERMKEEKNELAKYPLSLKIQIPTFWQIELTTMSATTKDNDAIKVPIYMF
jgi:hypothetical protein